MKKTILILLVSLFFISNVNAQVGKMQAGGQVGISIPIGTLGDGANLGFGFQGNFLYGITPIIDLTGSIGYVTWGTDTDNVSFSSVPLTFGGRYYFQRGEFTPYGLAELGIHFSSVDIPSVHIGGITYGGGSASNSDIGIGLGGGFLYDLGSVKLDVTGKINIVSGFNNLMIMAGAIFPLG
jgi:Outer membrane protein beta-barrel domain